MQKKITWKISLKKIFEKNWLVSRYCPRAIDIGSSTENTVTFGVECKLNFCVFPVESQNTDQLNWFWKLMLKIRLKLHRQKRGFTNKFFLRIWKFFWLLFRLDFWGTFNSSLKKDNSPNTYLYDFLFITFPNLGKQKNTNIWMRLNRYSAIDNRVKSHKFQL